MRTAKTILTVIQERGKRKLPLERVYKMLFNRELYLAAYAKLYSNSGAMTKGATNETVDGMSIQKIDNIIAALREEKYQWTPVRREYIPKKNGKKRPLGLPAWSDKLLQEVIRMILEAYYEPQFSEHSHGFRPNRGCHTALQEIQVWKGTKWFIEGDISKYFDTIDHDVLLGIIGKSFHDGRFLRLIQNVLKAGYIEDWKYNKTISGTPQGGIVSPILANIYLNEFDNWIETAMLEKYNVGKRKKSNPEYNKFNAKIAECYAKGDVETAKKLKIQRRNIPSVNTHDDSYRRLRYAILEPMVKGKYTVNLDETIFEHSEEDEIILCLNYDGLYGINNINRFLQNSNPNTAVEWGINVYKVGDPILFNESDRFSPLIYNNMKGRLYRIEKEDNRIWFEVKLDIAITEWEAEDYDFSLVDETDDGKSIIGFWVNKHESTDEDDDSLDSIVPFQVAYAVSIHKAQGLEYQSVKIVITNEVEELITHNIFYTAITRAKEKLKIYWSPETEKKILESLSLRNYRKDAALLASLKGLQL